jgi:broad specificity phosphatase PhoE
MNNIYFGLRHGESIPNTQGLIVSTPENGCLATNGLSSLGKQQASQVALDELIALGAPIAVLSSDFTRARETAETVLNRLKLLQPSLTLISDTVQLRAELRERNFGKYELTSNKHYEKVWEVGSCACCVCCLRTRRSSSSHHDLFTRFSPRVFVESVQPPLICVCY